MARRCQVPCLLQHLGHLNVDEDLCPLTSTRSGDWGTRRRIGKTNLKSSREEEEEEGGGRSTR
ncbi:hypothetical protein HID58_043475 [Brassica napus]|uniref:Uncharacterized protein n=1 Tax=Brassica napus TaxID=3708 RepID=A0ABQ8BGL6_BRANA|nr:hypothetical protein HID58_043475 [Brassica napus]